MPRASIVLRILVMYPSLGGEPETISIAFSDIDIIVAQCCIIASAAKEETIVRF